MIVNQDAKVALYGNLQTTFRGALQNAEEKASWNKIAMLVPSNGAGEVYDWLDAFPKMREWIGERVVHNIKDNNYTVLNKKFEMTVGVKETDIEDDKLGKYSTLAAQCGQSSAKLPDQLTYGLLNIAFGKGKGWDGVSFIGDHPYSDGKKTITVSNKSTKALSIETLAKARGSFGAARQAMEMQKDNTGEPLEISPTILLVPPTLRETATLLATADELEDGTKNPYKGTIEVLVSGRLTDPKAWFLLDMSQEIKPLIYQERKKPRFVKHDSTSSTFVFMNGEYMFGVDARAAAAYGFWQLIHGSTGADA